MNRIRQKRHLFGAFILLTLLSTLLPLAVSRFTPTGEVLLHESFDADTLPEGWQASASVPAPVAGVVTLHSPPRSLIETTRPAPPAGTYVRWAAKAGSRDIQMGARAWMHARIDLVPILQGFTTPDWHMGVDALDGKSRARPMQWRERIFLVPPAAESLYLRVFNAAGSGVLQVDALRLDVVRPSGPFLWMRLPIYAAWILLGAVLFRHIHPGRSLKGWLAMGAIALFVTLCLIPSALIREHAIKPLSRMTDNLQRQHHARSTAHNMPASPARPAAATPSVPSAPVTFPWDKIGHGIFLFGTTLLLAAWLADRCFPLPLCPRSRLHWLLGLTTGVALGSELLQNLSLMREWSWQDLLADAIGIAAAILLIRLTRKLPFPLFSPLPIE